MRQLANIVSSALLATGVLVSSTAAFASSQSGQITVVVKTADGNPAAGVVVKLSGRDLIGGERQGTTEADGMHRFNNLPPGAYKVTGELAMFQPAKAEGIVVAIGRTTLVNLTVTPVAPDGQVQEVVVEASKPVIDSERMASGASVSADFVENVPTGRTYQSIAQMVPGVSGGSNPNVMGGTSMSNQYLLDGINITDPVTNTFSANFNFDAIQEVEVITGGRDAEYGSAMGGVINIVTKSGSNEFEVDGAIHYDSSAMQIKGADEKGLNNRNTVGNVNVGGPIIEDTLWFYTSVEVPWSQRTLPAPDHPVFPDQGTNLHPTREFLGIFPLGKLTWQASESSTLKLIAQLDPARINNQLQDATTHPDAESKRTQGGYRFSLIDETYLTEGLFWKSSAAFFYSYLNNYPMSGNRNLAGHSNVDKGTNTINYENTYEDTRQRYQFGSSLEYSLDDFMGEHRIKAGVEVELANNHVLNTLNGGGSYEDKGLNPVDPASAWGAGLPYQYTKLINPQNTTIWSDTEGFYVQDVWKPLPGLTVRPGLRFDSARLRNYQNKVQIQINAVTPRIGIGWDPLEDGKTSLRVGYYQYADTGHLTLSDFAGGNSILTRTYDYNGVTEQYDQFLRESGGPSGAVGRDYLKDPWNQQRPRTHEIQVGISRELLKDVGFDATFTYRYAHNLWEDTETNLIWNAAGDQVIGYRDGQPHYIWSLEALPDAFSRYYGLSVSINRNFSDNLMMMVSYTWSKTQGTEPGEIGTAFDRPAMRAFEYGYLPQDLRHDLKIQSSYSLPFGIMLGATMTYNSGGPYNKYSYNAYFADYGDRWAPRGYMYTTDGKLKELRYPDLFMTDALVQWKLDEFIGEKVELSAQISNVFNTRTTITYETRDLQNSPSKFGDVTDKTSPFRAAVSARFRY